MSKKIIIASVVACILIAAVFFELGAWQMRRADFTDLNVQNDSVQAMLTFNRLQDERHWQYLLSNNCVPQARRAIDIAQDKDAELLARFLRGKLERGIVRYISVRDPNLIGELKTFKSKYGTSWFEEGCGH